MRPAPDENNFTVSRIVRGLIMGAVFESPAAIAVLDSLGVTEIRER
jgi:hypothetical protein